MVGLCEQIVSPSARHGDDLRYIRICATLRRRLIFWNGASSFYSNYLDNNTSTTKKKELSVLLLLPPSLRRLLHIFLLHAAAGHHYVEFSGILFALDKILRIIQSRKKTSLISTRILPL